VLWVRYHRLDRIHQLWLITYEGSLMLNSHSLGASSLIQMILSSRGLTAFPV
jgi:hypothetical protein